MESAATSSSRRQNKPLRLLVAPRGPPRVLRGKNNKLTNRHHIATQGPYPTRKTNNRWNSPRRRLAAIRTNHSDSVALRGPPRVLRGKNNKLTNRHHIATQGPYPNRKSNNR